jgi:hypothetical protein
MRLSERGRKRAEVDEGRKVLKNDNDKIKRPEDEDKDGA